MLWKIRHTERQILYGLTTMLNLKSLNSQKQRIENWLSEAKAVDMQGRKANQGAHSIRR